MADALPVAIVGAGLMGTWHARYARLCGASICGVVDRNKESASRLASEFKGARGFADLGELFEQRRPVVMHLCTPVESHLEIAEAAIRFGANLLMEKPLVADELSSRELIARAEQNGLLLAPVHQFLFQDGFLRAQAAIPGLGRILHMDATFCTAGGERGKGFPDEIAAEILPHPLSMVERLLPDGLAAFRWNATSPLAGEWRATGESDGVSVSILISLQGRPTESSMRIITGGGVINLDLFHGFATIDQAPVSKATKIARPFRRAAMEFQSAGLNLTRRLMKREFAYPGLRTLIFEFYRAVLHGLPAPVSPGETLAVARARDQLLQKIRLSRSTSRREY